MAWIEKLAQQVMQLGPERVGPLYGVLRALNRQRKRWLCWWVGLGDRAYARRTGDQMMPPARLRFRVHGAPDVESFLAGGQVTSEHIRDTLARLGRPLGSDLDVLDWGCGCGRTLRWFAHDEPTRYTATDIDAEAVAWASERLPFATFTVNQALPPLPFADASFDVVYAVSVLTHLDESFQFQWLDELKRVSRPGALLLLSVHAASSWGDLPENARRELEEKGFLYHASESWKGLFPAWYQNAFHTPDYIQRTFSTRFEVVEQVSEGMSERQDLVVLRNNRT